jgi:uncharacterized delta-60 repeat protein
MSRPCSSAESLCPWFPRCPTLNLACCLLWLLLLAMLASPAAGAPSRILSPEPGSNLPSSTITFQWADVGASEYQLSVGSTRGGGEYAFFSSATATSVTVNRLPLSSRVYVRLFTRLPVYNAVQDYVYNLDRDGDGVADELDADPVVPAALPERGSPNLGFRINPSGRVGEIVLDQATHEAIIASGLGGNVLNLTRGVMAQVDDRFDFIIYVNDQSVASTVTVAGVCYQVVSPATWGSAGRLKASIHLPSFQSVATGGGPTLHEILHVWANSVIPTQNSGHWGYAGVGGQLGGWDPATLVSLGGNAYQARSLNQTPGYNSWFANANGGNSLGYAPLELYLMGLAPAAEVPVTRVAQGFAWIDSATGKFSATGFDDWSVARINAQLGAKVPNYATSQKQFSALFVVLTPARLHPGRLADLDQAIRLFGLPGDDGAANFNFWEATKGRGSLQVDAAATALKAPTTSPVITSPATAAGRTGQPLEYRVSATNSPTAFAVAGLPTGLSFDAATARISGVPVTAGVHAITLQATNASGTGQSTLTLTVEVGPLAFLTQPQSLVATSGQPATLSATVHSSGTPTYGWRRNGVPLAGATNASFTIPQVSRAEADFYDVVVTDHTASVTSAPARLAVAPTSYPGVVAPDPAWRLQPEIGGGTGFAAAPLADGRCYLGGQFTSLNGSRRTGLARTLADGTLDPTFHPPELDGLVRTLLVQPDGRLLVGGDFLHVAGVARGGVVRLQADGAVDPTFLAGADLARTHALLLLADGRILAGGTFAGGVARLHADGTRDGSFAGSANGTVSALARQPDGKILLGGSFTSVNATARSRVARLEGNGALDTSFGGTGGLNNQVRALALQADGRVVVGGAFTAFGATAANYVARLNSDGTLDTAFAAGIGSGFSGPLHSVSLQADGMILAGGEFGSFNGATQYLAARLNADGTRDPGFLTLGFNGGGVQALVPDASGRLIAGGTFNGHFNPGGYQARASFARLNGDGTLAAGFDFAIRTLGNIGINSTQPLAGGKVLVTGYFTHLRGVAVPNSLARLNADGTVDTTFNPGGAGADYNVQVAAVQPDGRILISGQFSAYNGVSTGRIARLKADGTLDPTFNPGSGLNLSAYTLQFLPGGRIFAGGLFTAINGVSAERVAVLQADGARDASFGSGAIGSVFTAVVQPDGRIVIGGEFVAYAGTPINRLARLNPDGTRDTQFVVGSGANGAVTSLALQPDGRILLAGNFTSYNGTARSGVARVLADGSLDPTFVPAAVTGPVQNLLLQEDGKVLLHGGFTAVAGEDHTAVLARLNADGSRDPGFVAGGFHPATGGSNLSLRDDGKLLLPSGGTVGLAASQAAVVPTVTTPPASQTVNAGARATFSVVATGVPAPAFQWYKAGAPIPGATASTLDLARAQLPDAGEYAVTVTNVVGEVTSAPAVLTVTDNSRTVVLNDGHSFDAARGLKGFFTGGDFYVTVSAGGATFWGNNKWQRGVVSLGDQGAVPFNLLTAPASGYTRQGVAAVVGHTYVALLGTDAVAQYVMFRVLELTATSVTLRYEVIVDSALPPGILVPPPAALQVFQADLDPPPLAATAVGAGVSYQWLRNEVAVAGTTGPTLRLVNAVPAQSGSYRLQVSNGPVTVLSAACDVTVLALAAPAITTPPPAYVSAPVGGSLSAYAGFRAVPAPGFSCTRDGLPVTGAGIGAAIGDGANPDRGFVGISFVNATVAHSGTYVFTLANSQGTVTATPVIVEVGAARAPLFSLSPVAAEVLVGGATAFTAFATGIPTPAVKWRLSTTGGATWADVPAQAPYAGVTTTRLSITGATAGMSGTLYRAVATNVTGSAESDVASLTVFASAEVPVLTQVPAGRAVRLGGTTTFTVAATGTGTLAYQWLKDGSPLAAGTRLTGVNGPSLTIAEAQFADAGGYAVAVTNLAGAATSAPAAALAVVDARQGFAAGGYRPGGRVTILNTLTYVGSPVSLGWQVVLPEGWSYASGAGSEGEVKPAVGTTGLLEWSWTTVPASPVSFSFTLNVPAGTTGEKPLQAINLFRQAAGVTNLLVLPDPLLVPLAPERHSADSSGDGRISLFELTRVIELFNTRLGVSRTGCYRVQAESEDGFAPEPTRGAATPVVLDRFHSADTNADGKLSLFELTRVIELFNFRSGAQRTGQYRVQAGTEDGFAPGP